MGRTVIVAYKPKRGRETGLLAAVDKHLRVLREQNLITEREGWVMRARDGSVVEVFEWKSAAAIEQAHGNAAVQALWEEFSAVCEYVPLTSLAETRDLFAEFDTIDSTDPPL